MLNAKISRDATDKYLGSNTYDKRTLKLINVIEKDIRYASERGFCCVSKHLYEIKMEVNFDKFKEHFESKGYNIVNILIFTSSYGCKIASFDINW